MLTSNNSHLSQSSIKSDEEILLEIGISIDSLKSLKRQKRTYYKNIIQCLRKFKVLNNQEAIDNYLEAIGYLCETKDFLPIQIALNNHLPLNQNFPEITVCFSEYLLIKGLYIKLTALCQKILDSFVNENIDLLEIELLFAKGKSGIIDRVSGCQLFQEVHNKAERHSIVYIASLVCLAHQQIWVSNYKHSSINLNHCLNIISNYYNLDDIYNIYAIEADILEGLAGLERINNNWKKALLLYEDNIILCKAKKMTHKLISPLLHKGVINRKMKRYELALESLQEAKKIATNINSQHAIEWVNHHLSYVFLDKGQYGLAEQLSKECLEKAILEKRDNATGDFYEQFGLIQLAKGKIDEAIKSLRLSLSFRQKVGNNHGMASSYKHLSLAYIINKNYLESYQMIKECLTIFSNLKILSIARIYSIIRLFYKWIVGNRVSKYTSLLSLWWIKQ